MDEHARQRTTTRRIDDPPATETEYEADTLARWTVGARSESGDFSMATDMDDVIGWIRELEETTELLRKVLLDYRKGNVVLVRLLSEGVPTLEALERAGAPRMRPELTDALDQFAGARHQARLALLARAVEEGASMSDAGKAFSVSRQLVSRTISERRGRDDRSRGSRAQ